MHPPTDRLNYRVIDRKWSQPAESRPVAATDIPSDKAVKAAIKGAVESGKASKISDGGGLVLDARSTHMGWWRLRCWRRRCSELRTSDW